MKIKSDIKAGGQGGIMISLPWVGSGKPKPA